MKSPESRSDTKISATGGLRPNIESDGEKLKSDCAAVSRPLVVVGDEGPQRVEAVMRRRPPHYSLGRFDPLIRRHPNGGFRPIVFSNESRDTARLSAISTPVGCLRSLRAHVALDGVSWVQSGSVEIAVGQRSRMLQNRRRHPLPPSGVAPLGSSVRPPVRLVVLAMPV